MKIRIITRELDERGKSRIREIVEFPYAINKDGKLNAQFNNWFQGAMAWQNARSDRDVSCYLID